MTLRPLSIIRLIHPHVLLPATTALGTIHPQGREMGILSGANVVMPNLSPVDVRDKYKLYDNKICTGDEAAECRHCMSNRMKSIGYEVVVSRGILLCDGIQLKIYTLLKGDKNMYDVKSMKAEEFISDEEIRETLEYAEANKNNVELIDQIIGKARLRKGLTHREASVLLACEMPDKIEEVYELAKQIKQDFYGNRIVLLPLCTFLTIV